MLSDLLRQIAVRNRRLRAASLREDPDEFQRIIDAELERLEGTAGGDDREPDPEPETGR